MKVRILLQKESNFMNNVDGYMRHYALSPVCIMVQQMLRLCMSVHCLLGWFGISSFLFRTNDLSIGSAETKYIKLPYFREQFPRKLFFFGSWSAATIQGRKLLFSCCFVSIHNLNTCRTPAPKREQFPQKLISILLFHYT